MFDEAARHQREAARRVAADARALLTWIKAQPVPPSLKMLAQRCPLALRNRPRRDAAIAFLLRQGKVRRKPQGRATVLVPT